MNLTKTQQNILDRVLRLHGKDMIDYFQNPKNDLVVQYLYEGKLVELRYGKRGHCFHK